ncbi:TPA: hypothetical protein OTY64_003080 [Enterobacter hormaechei]|uniref:hypothetical protein n=1 Tax=unclassified Enterobacter cloacae complex TaxID=2757714 RepID=UPI0018691837|nr:MULTISPECIES: hypothetical protein [unclassified Enterobacter cloacae complex]MBE3263086.1 hypothetical protein [Enterobacter cloacae complex sp. P34C]MBE3284066.1 hypothetical protein [Enterobacter cloacae complex sp. P33B]MCM7745484.1 hypothetical protein [Enterobacter hormaechei]HCT4796281.1 hypothetical protein [Enterobacter hormaechei]
MTLDALFQLMKIISPSEIPSDGDLANFMTMLISTKNHSDALLPFSQRAYMLSVAYRDPQKAAALLSSCQPEAGNPLPLLNFSGWPDVRYATSGELQTPESEDYFHKITSAATILRAAIIEAEQQKNTPAFYILDKVLSLNSALPERYKKMANISYS